MNLDEDVREVAAKVLWALDNGTGWTQGRSFAKNGEQFSACTSGLLAMQRASLAVHAVVAEKMQEMFPGRCSPVAARTGNTAATIVNINDHPDTTAEDIRALFEKLAAS